MGDFLGVLPVMIQLSKQDLLHVNIHPESLPLFHLLPKKYRIMLQEREEALYGRKLEIDILKAFALSHQYNCYMSQAHFPCLGLPLPPVPVKAELEFEAMNEPVYDYVLAPFSRSLPPQQRWAQAQWQRLVQLLPEKSFCIIGHARDEKDFVTGDHIAHLYNASMVKLINVLKKARGGLISVVSGPSHLAFHLGVRNYLLTNQPMTWGINPEAVKICDPIGALKAEKVAALLREKELSVS